VHIGSDDWVHPDAFDVLSEIQLENAPMPDFTAGDSSVWRRGPTVVAQRRLTLVDVARGVAQRCFVHGRYGCIPWLVPAKALEPDGYAPIPRGHMRGIDGALVRGMSQRPNWIFQEAKDAWCVDFKTDTNITPYRSISKGLGVGAEEPAWPLLAEFYPAELVRMAEEVAA
jgi:hypothetical protein